MLRRVLPNQRDPQSRIRCCPVRRAANSSRGAHFFFNFNHFRNEKQIFSVVDLRGERSFRAVGAVVERFGVAGSVTCAKIHVPDASRSGPESSRQMPEVRDDACSSKTKKQTSNVQRSTSDPK